MTVRVSLPVLLAASAIVALALLALAHTIGFYVQLLVFAAMFVVVVALLARRGWRRTWASVRRRRHPPER